MTTTPIKDTSVALDEGLDARRSIQNIQDSDLPGGAIYNQCSQIIAEIDGLLAGLRRPK